MKDFLFLDSHRAEEDKNYWVIVTGNPGDEGGSMLDRPEPSEAAFLFSEVLFWLNRLIRGGSHMQAL